MELDLSQHFCPNPECQHHGIKGLGNITTSTTFGKNNIRLLRCKTCNKRFSERHSTVFSGLHLDEKTITEILLCLAEGMSIRGCARVKTVNKDTVQRVLERARQHCIKVLSELLKDLHLTECQLDELWSFIKKRVFPQRVRSRSS
ncbi:MAG: helix-turn-helix domain-containing protein [bacterium]|nr:helix-turn-helix domain-containing protein [bacterium]